MDRPNFVYVIYIKTTRERLWAALTQGEQSREYWGGRQVESDWQPGSPVTFRREDGALDVVRARVIEVEPQRQLKLLWTYALEPTPPASRVTYSLDRAGPEEIKLTVVHEEFEPGSEVDEGLRNGWPAILSSLKSWLETGVALDMTKRWAREGR